MVKDENHFYNSPLGTIQISAADNNITALLFLSPVDDEIVTPEMINKKSPTSVILKKCVAQLDDYFAGKNLDFDLPLEQDGTAFQQNVWNGLLDIKAGKTLSYLQFSKQLGNTKAIRAVGTANGKNKIAIIVPCHRVIGSNGHLVGYAGELWRKQWLLEHEAKHINGVQSLFN